MSVGGGLILFPKGDAWEGVSKALVDEGYKERRYASDKELLSENLDSAGAVVISDTFPGMDGQEILSRLNGAHPRLPLILVTSSGSSSTVIEAIKRGAFDCLEADQKRGVDIGELLSVVEDAVEAGKRMERQVVIGEVEEESGEDLMIGRSREMVKVYKELGRLSATPVTVLIHGETGTGKELIARSLYQHGHRAHRSFTAVNCAAIPANLIESELFGHEKGAFTGAVATRVGKFEQAHGATLFLDEIGDLDLSLQAKLLRVLQEKQIQRVGGRELIPVDVRLIAATHQNLEKMIEDGTFREDLFYRLNVANIELPPLRDRQGDVPLLAKYFLAKYGAELGIEEPSMTDGAMAFLEGYGWPGNVRELQNVVRKSLLESRAFGVDEGTVKGLLEEGKKKEVVPVLDGLESLAESFLGQAESGEITGAYQAMLEAMERELLAKAMEKSGGNQAKEEMVLI